MTSNLISLNYNLNLICASNSVIFLVHNEYQILIIVISTDTKFKVKRKDKIMSIVMFIHSKIKCLFKTTMTYKIIIVLVIVIMNIFGNV